MSTLINCDRLLDKHRHVLVVMGTQVLMIFSLMAKGEDLPMSAVPASAVPQVDTASWHLRDLKDLGFRIRLPERYKEKRWAVTVGSILLQSYRAGLFDRIDFQVEDVPSANPSDNKITRQASYLEYTECGVAIAGREFVIQSFREPEVIFDGGRWLPAYEVMAVCQLSDRRLLRVSSGVASRQAQEEVLAALRTIEFAK